MIKTFPIGTVVQLGGMKEKIMIAGRQQINNEENGRVYDYSGYPYPQGMDGDDVYLFDAEQIVMVYHIGYQDLDEVNQKFIIAEIAKEVEAERTEKE
ncbi:DUF4176 domain-containing protein [Butyrivibrio sp. NC2002]|uniref:DUF4176 domain-containing protein n=1 Tax=Butyrivibrio sp. NC2002 TaxID=1410610 RepID=UPI00056A9D08|nr:DUF4176 domain-containing protein [Butyrivibrio sp. NC2002]